MSQEGQDDPLRTESPPSETPPAPELAQVQEGESELGDEEMDCPKGENIEGGTQVDNEEGGEADVKLGSGTCGKNINNTQSNKIEEDGVRLEEESRNGEMEGRCLESRTGNGNRSICEGEDTQTPQSSTEASAKLLCSLRSVI